MLGRQHPEDHRRADRRAGAGIGVVRDRACDVTGGIEALDRRTIRPQDIAHLVCFEPALGADIAYVHRNGIERALLDWAEAWIGRVARIAEERVVSVPAAL